MMTGKVSVTAQPFQDKVVIVTGASSGKGALGWFKVV